MFVKYENGELVSLFAGCVPDDLTGYEEVPDDEKAIADFIAKNRKPAEPAPSPEERIAALEEQLAAAKILLGVE